MMGDGLKNETKYNGEPLTARQFSAYSRQQERQNEIIINLMKSIISELGNIKDEIKK